MHFLCNDKWEKKKKTEIKDANAVHLHVWFHFFAGSNSSPSKPPYTRYPEWVTDVDGLMSTKCAVCWEALRDVVCNPGTLWLVCWCQLSERRWRPGPHCRRSLSDAGVSCSCLVWCWSAPWPALRELVTAWGSGMKAHSAQELIDTSRMCGNKCLNNINRLPKVLMRKWCKRLYWEHLAQMNSCKWVWCKTIGVVH